MLFYLIQGAQSDDAGEPGLASYPLYEDCMLPVYTSPESLTQALKAYAASSQEFDYIGWDMTGPFELAEMVGSFEAHGLKFLLFDPPPAPDGSLWILGDPIPVGEYRSLIEEIRAQFERLPAEAAEQFCQPSSLMEEPYVRWPAQSAEGIAADLRARIEELIVCDDL